MHTSHNLPTQTEHSGHLALIRKGTSLTAWLIFIGSETVLCGHIIDYLSFDWFEGWNFRFSLSGNRLKLKRCISFLPCLVEHSSPQHKGILNKLHKIYLIYTWVKKNLQSWGNMVACRCFLCGQFLDNWLHNCSLCVKTNVSPRKVSIQWKADRFEFNCKRRILHRLQAQNVLSIVVATLTVSLVPAAAWRLRNRSVYWYRDFEDLFE